MSRERMREFWDERAREDPFYFVDSRLDYGSPDRDRFWAGGEEDLDRLLGALDVAVIPSDVVVDLGCGVGRLTRPLAARSRRVLAVDVSPEMVALARENNPRVENVDWIVGDGESLGGIDDGEASVVVSHVVLQHVPDPAVTLGYIREMGRVLAPEGWAAFQVSNDPAVHRAASHGGAGTRSVRRLRGVVGRGPRGTDEAEWLGSAVDLAEVARAAEDGGMDVERVVGAGTQFCLIRAEKPRATEPPLPRTEPPAPSRA